ncbi:TonB-dependent receptor [Larkinella punicea]|uniref:TonB-dependent receptor n=1 Tax=Larkinella punicea TaxID=2315727 RepID=A0A368JDD7_9BACT|nr:TonB-dependent receptor [Larkinella punicea]RCR65679.1 TonB-dependent receptor [Larkinella punicea]
MNLRTFIFLTILSAVANFALAQQYDLRGTVHDEAGSPLPSVTVYLKNTKYTTLSNGAGTFQINNVTGGKYTLILSYVGFGTVEKTIDLRTDTTLGTIVLTSTAKELAEVSVKAEKQTKVQETKPITISSIQIKDVVAQNVLLTDVVDRLSGVRIRRSSSLGDGSDISINGIRGTAIRVYIDGLPMEFMYPRFDISTLPIGQVKRVDVYKGVLPVDVGTDAMGGGINLITEQKMHNSLRASYNVGSFNTHLADFSLSLANSKNYFVTVSGAYNYSDNDYRMNALVFEKNKVEQVRRFHDQYRMAFGGITVGTHSKPWADELKVSLNLSGGYKQLMNGARVTNTAFGEAVYHANNLSAILNYTKSFLNEKVQFSTIGNYSREHINYVDTTRNVYSWSGAIVGRRSSPGEYTNTHSDTYTDSWVNRSTLTMALAPNHKLLLSNLYARQTILGKNYLLDPARDYLRIPQDLTKNIAGLQYEAFFFNRLTFTAAAKRFDYNLNGAENLTLQLIRKKNGFWGWNTGLKYDLSPGLFARASFEKGYLIPQFYQFVGNGADVLRNTDLRPESSDNLNLGITVDRPVSPTFRIASAVNGFYRKQHDVIFLGNTIFTRYENADEVRTLGVEGDVLLSYKTAFSLKTNVTFMRKTFAKIEAPENQFLVGAAFPNNPNFFANTEFSWQKGKLLSENDHFRVYVFYNHIATFNYIQVGKDNSPSKTPTAYVPTQNRVDAGLSYKLNKPGLTTSVNVLNIFNAELFDNFLVPRAGTSFNVKIIYEIANF